MQNVIKALAPLFKKDGHNIKAAYKADLIKFKVKANSHGVPITVIEQLIPFYSQVAEVPCLDSLVIHGCDDITIFEWWEDGELWLGSRDYHILRWSSQKSMFCVGDASNVSFGKKEEFKEFTDAVMYLVNVYS